jgi:hemoglobin-like flavoprotein
MSLACRRQAPTGGDKTVTPDQVALVQDSWRKVLPISETAAELFYSRLFALDPALKPLFKGDMKMQGRKLMAMLGLVISGLGNFDRMAPAIKELGRRHVAYGVRPPHYRTVAEALLWTLKQGLGDALTEETELAWVAAYGKIVALMQSKSPVAAA